MLKYPLIEKLEDFYQAFIIYWEKLYKPYGLEISNIRLGGLISRIKYVKTRLLSFINGEVTVIPELEEKLLDKNGGLTAHYDTSPLLDNTWGAIVTINLL